MVKPGKLDRRLLEASADLGGKARLHLSRRHSAVVAAGGHDGVALVTNPASRRVSDPELARRGKVFFIGNCAGRSLPAVSNWPFGSAIAVTLVAVVVVVLMVAMRIAWKVAGTRTVDLV